MCGFPGSNAVDLLEVFELARYGDAESFARHKSISNRRLLWHGTNVACAAAIVSSGLRVMGSGGRVGTGIYLADEAGKSGHYVRTTQDGVGVMFLAEAALGKQFHVCKETPEIHRLCKAPAGFDSVKAVGKSCPDPSGDVVLKLEGNDVMFATGTPVQVKADKESSYSQNEFLVYDPSQVLLRYLV
jgi:poly [ADP-ribose] polymerase